MKKVILLLLFLVMISACKTEDIYKPISDQQPNKSQWSTFEHPTKVFTINIPKDWGSGQKLTDNPNVFSFFPSETADFTLSITQNLNLPKELPVSFVQYMFPEETPITELKRNRGEGWNSIRQDFKGKEEGKEWIWLAVFYGVGSNNINITLSDSSENINNYKEIFEKSIDSIAINTEIL